LFGASRYLKLTNKGVIAMPRARDPAREHARELWEQSDENLNLCDIAERLSIAESKIRTWKCRDKWVKKR